MSTLVSIFGVTTNCELFTKVNFGDINTLGTQYGYIVMPEAANRDVYRFIYDNRFNPNKTLYNSWSAITSKSRLELFIDQVRHYASTYGTCFTGEPLIFRDGDYEIKFDNFKIIDAVSNSEMYDLCMKQLTSGVAMNSADVEAIVNYVIWYVKNCTFESFGEVIETIKNNEAKLRLYSELNLYPKNGVELFKYLVYKATGLTQIIINKDLYERIEWSNYDLYNLSEDDLIHLSECFNRFKYLFMAFKNASELNKPIVNKIRRYAKKYHKPMVQAPSMNIVDSFYDNFDALDKELKKTTNYRLVSLLNYLNSLKIEDKSNMYNIRNGKVYVTTKGKTAPFYIDNVILYIKRLLVDNLKKKAGIVKFNDFIELACPTSTKNFIGEFPFGSNMTMNNHNYIGIYWENGWGTFDFDLSMIDVFTGEKYGWNSAYYSEDKNVVYSGDITSAPNGASEVIKVVDFDKDAVILVNRFRGETNSKFMLFGGTSKKKFDSKSKYMVDPNTIKFKDSCVSTNKESVVGYVTNNKLYFASLPYSNARVSSAINMGTLNDAMKKKVTSYTYLKDILLEAGFIEFNPEVHDKCDYDFSEINKNTLVELFS